MDQDTIDTIKYFHYIPNKILGFVGIGVFGAFHFFLFGRVALSKSRLFLYILSFTALAEAIGYYIRAACSTGGTSLMKYMIMTMCLLLSPNALALVNYKALGEVVKLSNVERSPFYLRPKFITWFFFASDVFSFMMQGSGGGMQTNGGTNAALGKKIILIGLALQLVFFAIFALLTIHVDRNPKYNYSIVGHPNAKRNMMRCLYITLILLYIRSVYRVAEYATGFDGVIASTEWAFYAFDGLPIALSFATYSILFIGDYIPKRNEVNGGFSRKISTYSTSVDNLTNDNGFEMHHGNNNYSNV